MQKCTVREVIRLNEIHVLYIYTQCYNLASLFFQLCNTCLASQGKTFNEFRVQVKTLTDLINGAPHSDTEDNAEESDEDGKQECFCTEEYFLRDHHR